MVHIRMQLHFFQFDSSQVQISPSYERTSLDQLAIPAHFQLSILPTDKRQTSFPR